jgi:hypothetical protein
MGWQDSQVFESKIINLGITAPASKIYYESEKLEFATEGPRDDRHSGHLMLSSIREEHLFPKGSPVFNYRQVAITSSGESTLVVAKLPRISELTAADLLSNIHLEGREDLSKFPPGSIIEVFAPNGEQKHLVLYVTGINNPCIIVQENIEKRLGKGAARGYVKAAEKLRGILAIVYQAGVAKVGDKVTITTPEIWIPDP